MSVPVRQGTYRTSTQAMELRQGTAFGYETTYPSSGVRQASNDAMA